MADLSQATRDAVREGAKRSAGVVLPMVFEYLGTPSAILDVGAGEGHWLDVAHELVPGWTPLLGLDLEVCGSPEHDRLVTNWNAESSTPMPSFDDGGTRWPLALCLEMAEHVSPAAGDHLVSELCRVADAVLWSAAIPGQGGDGHVNEQWPDYWQERFERHGWHLHDPGLRDDIWSNVAVEPWYRQNLLLAYEGGNLPSVAHPPFARVHPVTWAHHRGVHPPSVV